MLKEIIKKAKRNEQIPLEDAMEVINHFAYTSASLMRDGQTIFAMEIDHAEREEGSFCLSQDTNYLGSHYYLADEDVAASESKTVETSDETFFFTDITLKDGSHLKIVTYSIDSPKEDLEDREIGMWEFNELVEEINHLDKKPSISVEIRHINGYEVSAMANEMSLMDDDVLRLRCGTGAVIRIPMSDEGNLHIYKQDLDEDVSLIIINPDGTPFTEVTLIINYRY